MKKIPTVFQRDWEGDRSRVLNKVNSGCEWVLAGEGIATVKYDGTCCMVLCGVLWKRRELREGDITPPDFMLAETDKETHKIVGWVKVGDGPEDRYHREARDTYPLLDDGTYELIGPKIQGNPENSNEHILIRHGVTIWLPDVPRDFENMRDFLRGTNIEGIVFYNLDGRMAKIKLRDFGLKREKKGTFEQFS